MSLLKIIFILPGHTLSLKSEKAKGWSRLNIPSLVSCTVVLTTFSYADLLLVILRLDGERLKDVIASENNKGCRVKPKCRGMLSCCINILFTDLLLVKPTLQHDGYYFRRGPGKISDESVRKKMKTGCYIPSEGNEKGLETFFK